MRAALCKLYAKLTTQSNTYTVHYRVQKLKKARCTSAAQWDESKDNILGEYRGSSLIERYVDPGDANLQSIDFATSPPRENRKVLQIPCVEHKKIQSLTIRIHA
jgi:hypothetical protein